MIERVKSEAIEGEVVEPVEQETGLTAPKLDLPLKMRILAMIAREEKYKVILGILEKDHGIKYSVQSLRLLKKNHAKTIAEMQGMVLDKEASEVDQIRTRALRQLARKLDQATEAEREIAQLDEEYRAGDMELAEYRRKKTGLLNMSVSELLAVSKEMHGQSGAKGKGASIAPNPHKPGSDEPLDPQAVEVLLTAIQNGDTITLSKQTIKVESNV